MLYTINWLEEKEWDGKKYLVTTVKPLDGPEFEATLWGDKWGARLATLKAGEQIEANPWQSPKNQKWTLYPPDPKKPSGGGNSAFKGQQIEKAQDRKNEFIGKTLDRKEESIKLMSAQRDAVLIVTMLFNTGVHKSEVESDLKMEIIKWRNWFLNDKDFNTPPPF